MRRAILAALLGAGAMLSCPTAASAHADYVSSTPGNGSTVSSVPSTITVKFNEAVTLATEGVKIINGNGASVGATATARGNSITIRPTSPLKTGRYAVAWHILSDDGHPVSGASSFAVKLPTPSATATSIPTKPSIPVRISGAKVGSRTLTFDRKIKSGTVEWTSSALTEPLTWTAYASKSKGKATGILPFAGTWTMKATLYTGSSVIVVIGSVYVAP